ncbi:predicted atp-dependent endonuclease of the old family [Bacillus sp. OxB-1]|uniref:ATP-dependent nuclease n=1 Tax=Bacillus sp. (strain OxB-1) TaxID=98228 RepID=UPI0005820395|nr:AAA family ATPase [Bacillus sp. OxB-1]BAQ09537.1 predicted atp-dependent endonuclease of the old family [Bacillus sp. OxB-1]
MHIEEIHIQNFRLLKDVRISLEEKTTVIVGRNNSGKTSFAELFRRLTTESLPSFKLEDFSLEVHNQFWKAYEILQKENDEVLIRENLPTIEITISINYRNVTASFGLLSEFVIDLNPNCTNALINISYQLDSGKIQSLFENLDLKTVGSEEKQKNLFFRTMKERVPKLYKVILNAVDPNDPANQKSLEWKKFQNLLQGSFINAQRELGDMTSKEKDILGKILEGMFNSAKSDSANAYDQGVAESLNEAVKGIQEKIDSDFNEQLTGLLPTFSLFGYPGLPDPKLLTETVLNVDTLLRDHTKIRYTGVNGVHLPETYNGLGARNLIFILLKLLEFYKEFIAKKITPISQIIFIEEPEAHLHPQMQEVFVSKLNDLIRIFSETFNNGVSWPVQFVITTHSSHMANKSDFSSIRYFMASKSKTFYSTKIKDLKVGVKGTLGDDVEFLQQYMTLTRCDLFFADKAVLIEGTTERLLLPTIIEKLDVNNPNINLGSQYISVIEVGGAYAHKFFGLLEYLELKALVITDIDTVDSKNHGEKCKVADGDGTSNYCIKEWFNSDVSPKDLLEKTREEKIKGKIAIAYQVPEKDVLFCGRSFEDAFILANPNLFGIYGNTPEKQLEYAWKKAKNIKKVEFALEYALEKKEWNIPKYINDGLLWLASNELHSITKPSKARLDDVFEEVAASKEDSYD